MSDNPIFADFEDERRWLGGAINALQAENERLVDLLRIEQQLALRGNPFCCRDSECAYYGQKLFARDCRCFDMQAEEHRERVRRAIEPSDE